MTRDRGFRTHVFDRRAALSSAVILLAAATAGAAPPEARVSGSVHRVTVVAGDTLGLIGARQGVAPATLASDNGLKLDAVLRIGRVLRIDNRHVVPASASDGTIVINVPQRMLFFVYGGEVAALPVAVGRRTWPTPLTSFSVTTKETDPSWEVPASIQAEARRAGTSLPAVVPPGPDNPLGAHWLGLSVAGIGIHGTNAPTSVYQTSTHGCIRLHPDDIAWLFGAVAVGTSGRLVYEPVLLATDGDDVFLEVNPDVYGKGPADVVGFVTQLAEARGLKTMIDWRRVVEVIAERAGVARAITR